MLRACDPHLCSVRYEALKKLLKRLAAARETREKAEAAERTSPAGGDDEVEINILTMTEPPAPAPRVFDMGFDYESVLRRGPEIQVEEKPLESLLTCLDEDGPANSAAAAAAAAAAASGETGPDGSSGRGSVSPAVAAAILMERELESKFLRMLDEDARTVDDCKKQRATALRAVCGLSRLCWILPPCRTALCGLILRAYAGAPIAAASLSARSLPQGFVHRSATCASSC